MKPLSIPLVLLSVLSSCVHKTRILVQESYIDSLISRYSPSVAMVTSEGNIAFWQRRMEKLPDNFVNGPEYASALVTDFRFSGNIDDLRKADSLYKRSNEANQEKEAGIFRTMASLAMLQHRFRQADSFLKRAIRIEGYSVPNAYLDFDISFELGRYSRANNILESLYAGKSYAYLFRRSKFEHYEGSLNSSISCMLAAAQKAGNNTYIRQTALSNAANLCLHKADPEKATQLYLESLKIDAADFHSLVGLSWIALVHDKNYPLAEKILDFVRVKNQAPEAILKLEQLAEAKGDKVMQRKYAEEFVRKVSDSGHGSMYNKYLIDLYTGILNSPSTAVILAKRELNERPTPQIFAWYCWSLYSNHQGELAYAIYKQFVSGKPLEGPELYSMGKLMRGMKKEYNAQEFFKAAFKNRYDLSPGEQKELEEELR